MQQVGSKQPDELTHTLLMTRLEAVFQALPVSLASSSVLGLLTCAVLFGHVATAYLAGWYAALLSANAWRGWTVLRYHAACTAPDSFQVFHWRRHFILGCALAGAAWGALAIVLFPAQPKLQVFIAFVLAGNAAGAVTSLAVERWAAYAFVLPSILPLALRLLILGDIPSIAMSIMVIMFLLMISASVNRSSQQLVALVQSRLRADLHAQDLESAQQHLRAMNDRVTVATRAGRIGVWEWDVVSNVLTWDPVVHEMYQVDPASGPLNYETWRQRIHPQDLERVEAQLAAVLEGIDEMTIEFRIVLPGGIERYIKSAAVVQRSADGKALRVTGMNSDITELQLVGRMKSEFVSIVSHELRTPLTSIRGAVGLVASGAAGPVPAKILQLMELASRNAQRLAMLVDDILDMDKIECGRMRFEMRPQLLAPLLEQAITANLTYANMHQVKLVLRVGQGLDEVNVDANRLLQVLANLLSNAVKFSPAQGSVEVDVTNSAARTRVEVTDHGPGISQEFQQKVFGKFCQSDSSDKRVKGGSGLGLAISKAIIEQMHGAIGFRTSSAGTTFYIDLPRHRHEPGAEDGASTTIVPVTLG